MLAWFRTMVGATSVESVKPATAVADTNTATNTATRGVQLTLEELLKLRLNVGKSASRNGKRVVSPRAAQQRSRALGRGLDFAEVRNYLPGDDVRMIDWKVTARTNQVHTKLFEEEKERPVFIVVDFCRPMLFGSRGALKSVAAARLAAQLAWISASAGERVGGIVFADHRHLEIKPLAGSRGVMQLLRALVTLHDECLARIAQPPSQSQSHGGHSAPGNSAFGESLTRLRKIAHPGSVVLLLSDFAALDAEDPQTADLQTLRWLCVHTECIAARLVDSLEVTLPRSGHFPVSNGISSGRFNASRSAVRASHKSLFEQRNEQLMKIFAGRGNFFSQCTATEAIAPSCYGLLNRNKPDLSEVFSESTR